MPEGQFNINPGKVVLLFPGQSSADPGMIARARAAHPAANKIADLCVNVLGEAVANRYLGGNAAPLDCNRDVQIAVFLTSQMYLAALADEGVVASHSLGASLGEYSHLVEIGALDFASALTLVDERGRCYDKSPKGQMAAIMAASLDDVVEVVETVRCEHDELFISNFNGRTQHVITGSEAAIGAAIALVEDEYFAQAAIIERSVPMHTPMMAEVGQEFSVALEAAPWSIPSRPYHPNVTANPIANADGAAIAHLLARHVSEPVQWQESVAVSVKDFPDAVHVEVGPGRVLQNLFHREWRDRECLRADALKGADPAAHFGELVERLHAGH